jgi:ectoine hydrolase
MKRVEAAVVEGLEAGIDAARAGSRACDVALALAESMERTGFEWSGRCGYPVGLSYPPDLGERTISLRASDESVLEPNMTFHLSSALWMGDNGIEIAESIRITEDGAAEVFCNRPRGVIAKA